MKEKKEIMDELIKKIGNKALECMKEIDFENIIIGYFIRNIDDSVIKNIEFFYEYENGKFNYLNEIMYQNDNLSAHEDNYIMLHEMFAELYEHCSQCGDNWKCMTVKIDNNCKFNIDFSYDVIDFASWRKKQGIM